MEAMFDPEESILFGPILAGVADADERRAYRDWLVARGDLRGDVMTLLEALAGPVAPPEGAALRLRLRALTAEVDELWLTAVSGHAGLFNCGEARDQQAAVRFNFECPRRWESLEPTAAPDSRACDRCGETVHLCTTIAQAEKHARRGRCIAVPEALVRQAGAPRGLVVGRPDPPRVRWGDKLFRR